MEDLSYLLDDLPKWVDDHSTILPIFKVGEHGDTSASLEDFKGFTLEKAYYDNKFKFWSVTLKKDDLVLNFNGYTKKYKFIKITLSQGDLYNEKVIFDENKDNYVCNLTIIPSLLNGLMLKGGVPIGLPFSTTDYRAVKNKDVEQSLFNALGFVPEKLKGYNFICDYLWQDGLQWHKSRCGDWVWFGRSDADVHGLGRDFIFNLKE